MIHKMVDTPKVVAETPDEAHGDTDDSPRPVPRISRISERAAAAAAPAKIAPHETALACAWALTGAPTRWADGVAVVITMVVDSIR
ncbi:MAG: hypothetical protein EOP40_07765 [Rubrivivax sp.]|nr:MAG: hypothetical protein EOP40_07765 [Rubrivivax sp.]